MNKFIYTDYIVTIQYIFLNLVISHKYRIYIKHKYIQNGIHKTYINSNYTFYIDIHFLQRYDLAPSRLRNLIDITFLHMDIFYTLRISY